MLDPRPGVASAVTLCTVALDDDRAVATRIEYPWSRSGRGGDECPIHGGNDCLERYRLDPKPHARRGRLRLWAGRR